MILLIDYIHVEWLFFSVPAEWFIIEHALHFGEKQQISYFLIWYLNFNVVVANLFLLCNFRFSDFHLESTLRNRNILNLKKNMSLISTTWKSATFLSIIKSFSPQRRFCWTLTSLLIQTKYFIHSNARARHLMENFTNFSFCTPTTSLVVDLWQRWHYDSTRIDRHVERNRKSCQITCDNLQMRHFWNFAHFPSSSSFFPSTENLMWRAASVSRSIVKMNHSQNLHSRSKRRFQLIFHGLITYLTHVNARVQWS